MDVITEPVCVEPPVRRRRRWPLLVAVLVVAALATAGAILLLRDDAQRVPDPGSFAPPQPDLHHVIDPLPDGWVAHSAADVYPGEFSMWWTLDGSYQSSMYGTEDDPSAPAITLGVGDVMNQFGVSGMRATIEMTTWSVDGSEGTCGTSVTGVRQCYLVVDGTAVQTHSAGLAPDELQRLLLTLRVRDGIPQLDDAALPEGMVHLGSWRNQMPVPVGNTNGGTAVSVVRFNGPDRGLAVLTVGRADEQDISSAFEDGATTALTVDGVSYFHGASGEVQLVTWQDGGMAYHLLAGVAPQVDALALARGVRRATEAEWAAAAAASMPQFPRSDASTTTSPAPATLAPTPDAVVDVDVTVTATTRSDGGGVEISSTATAAPPLVLLLQPGGATLGLDGQFDPFGLEGGFPEVIMTERTDSWLGAVILTTDPRASQLRVTTADGRRYIADLVPFPGREGARTAAIVVPADQFSGADLIDEFGARLDAFGLPAD